MNWESEHDMAADVEENAELYEALADGGEEQSGKVPVPAKTEDHDNRIRYYVEADEHRRLR